MSDSDAKNETRDGVSQFSDDWYRTLMDEASDAMLTGDPQRNWIEVNRTACAMFGYTRDEFLTLNLRDIVAPEELPISLALAEKAQPGETLRTERTMVRKDGSRFLVETSVKILEGGYALLILRDIAARKEAE